MEVLVLGREPVEPRLRTSTLDLWRCQLGECEVVLGVPSPHLVGLVGLLEALGCVFADCFKHLVGRAVRGHRAAEEMLVDERCEPRDVRPANLLGGLKRATAGEDGQAGKIEALIFVEQVVAPFECRPERLLAGRQIAVATGEHR